MRTEILRNTPCSETAKLRSFAGLLYRHAERIRRVSWGILFSLIVSLKIAFRLCQPRRADFPQRISGRERDRLTRYPLVDIVS